VLTSSYCCMRSGVDAADWIVILTAEESCRDRSRRCPGAHGKIETGDWNARAKWKLFRPCRGIGERRATAIYSTPLTRAAEINALLAKEPPASEIHPRETSLEQYFLDVTGEPRRDDGITRGFPEA